MKLKHIFALFSTQTFKLMYFFPHTKLTFDLSAPSGGGLSEGSKKAFDLF